MSHPSITNGRCPSTQVATGSSPISAEELFKAEGSVAPDESQSAHKDDNLDPLHRALLLIPDLQSCLLGILDKSAPTKASPSPNSATQFERHLTELQELRAKIRTLHRENAKLRALIDGDSLGKLVDKGVLEKGEDDPERQAASKGKGKAVSLDGEESLMQMGSLFDETVPLRKTAGIKPALIADCAFRLIEGEDPRGIAGELFDEVERAGARKGKDERQVEVECLRESRESRIQTDNTRLNDVQGVLDILLTRVGDLEDGMKGCGKVSSDEDDWDNMEGYSYHV